MADQSRNPHFDTAHLESFIRSQLSTVRLTNSEKFTGVEKYLKVVMPVFSPFYVIYNATHLGIRGYCNGDPACMVLMDREENILLTIVIKNKVMLRQYLTSILDISGPASVQKQGMDAAGALEVIRELREIINEIIEKHPDAFRA